MQTSFLTYSVVRVGKLSHQRLSLLHSARPLALIPLIPASRKVGTQTPASQISKVIMEFHKTYHLAQYSAEHMKMNAINKKQYPEGRESSFHFLQTP